MESSPVCTEDVTVDGFTGKADRSHRKSKMSSKFTGLDSKKDMKTKVVHKC